MESRRSRVDAGTMLGIGWSLLVAALLRSVTSTSSPAETRTLAAGAWQNNLTTLHERFQHLYSSGRFSDLTIAFSSDNKTVLVHRLVLSASSPVFEPMLMGPSPVGEDLVLQDSSETFTKLLDHMYRDELELHSVDEALRVYATSLKYQIHSASKICSQYIRNHLTEETTLAVLETAVDFGDEALRDMCVTMLNKNPDAAIAPSSVLHLKKETLKGLLQGELHVSSETLIFDAVLAWGRAQLSQRGEEPSGSALRKEIEDLLREVRFLTMTCEEFIDSVLPSSVFSPVEVIHFLRSIRGADLNLTLEETPFSPSRKSRTRNVNNLIKLDVICCNDGIDYLMLPRDEIPIIQDFKSTEHILIHSLQINYDGIISINKNYGAEVVSTGSQNSTYTFQEPVPLKPDETYEIIFKPYKELRAESDRGNVRSIDLRETTIFYRSVYCFGLRILFQPGRMTL